MGAVDIFLNLSDVLRFGFFSEQFSEDGVVVFGFGLGPFRLPRTRFAAQTPLLTQFHAVETTEEVEACPVEGGLDSMVLYAFSDDTLSASGRCEIECKFGMRVLRFEVLLLLGLGKGGALANFLLDVDFGFGFELVDAVTEFCGIEE